MGTTGQVFKVQYQLVYQDNNSPLGNSRSIGGFVPPNTKQSWWASLPKILWHSSNDGGQDPSVASCIKRWFFSWVTPDNLNDLTKMGEAGAKLASVRNPGNAVAKNTAQGFGAARNAIAFLMPVIAVNKIIASTRNLVVLQQNWGKHDQEKVGLYGRDFVKTEEVPLHDRRLLVAQNVVNIATDSCMALGFIAKCMQTCDKWGKCLTDGAKKFTAKMSIFMCAMHGLGLVRTSLALAVDHRAYTRKIATAVETFAQVQARTEEDARRQNTRVQWPTNLPANDWVQDRQKIHIDHARKLTGHALTLMKTIVEFAKDILGFISLGLKSASASLAPIALAAAALEVVAAATGVLNIWLTRA